MKHALLPNVEEVEAERKRLGTRPKRRQQSFMMCFTNEKKNPATLQNIITAVGEELLR